MIRSVDACVATARVATARAATLRCLGGAELADALEAALALFAFVVATAAVFGVVIRIDAG